jgi:hypothetical protein
VGEQVFARIEEHLQRQEHRSLLFPLLPLWRSRNDQPPFIEQVQRFSLSLNGRRRRRSKRSFGFDFPLLFSFPFLPLTTFPPTVFQALPYPLFTEPQRSHRSRHRPPILSHRPALRSRCCRRCTSTASATPSCTVTSTRALDRERASTSSGEWEDRSAGRSC